MSTKTKKAKDSQEKNANFISLFGQTSKITGSLVFLPIAIALSGVFIDNKFGTTPRLTIGGIVFGFVVGFAHAFYLSKKYLK